MSSSGEGFGKNHSELAAIDWTQPVEVLNEIALTPGQRDELLASIAAPWAFLDKTAVGISWDEEEPDEEGLSLGRTLQGEELFPLFDGSFTKNLGAVLSGRRLGLKLRINKGENFEDMGGLEGIQQTLQEAGLSMGDTYVTQDEAQAVIGTLAESAIFYGGETTLVLVLDKPISAGDIKRIAVIDAALKPEKPRRTRGPIDPPENPDYH